MANKFVIVIIFVVLLYLSSVAGVVVWGASTNWWSPEDTSSPSEYKNTSGPSHAPANSVTINNQTFDPTGYTVSKGFWGDYRPLGTAAGTTTCSSSTCQSTVPSASDCRPKCVSGTN